MPVFAKIACHTKQDALAIEHAFEDPATYAFVIMVGVLQQLPSDRARTRVLRWVADKLAEEAPSLPIETEKVPG